MYSTPSDVAVAVDKLLTTPVDSTPFTYIFILSFVNVLCLKYLSFAVSFIDAVLASSSVVVSPTSHIGSTTSTTCWLPLSSVSIFPSVSSIPIVIVFPEFKFPLLSIIPTFSVPSPFKVPLGSAIDIGPL